MKKISVKKLFVTLKEQHDATLIGISDNGPESIQLNPSFEKSITSGNTLYYIAGQRIQNIDWSIYGV